MDRDEIFGELRAALDATSTDPAHIAGVAWCLVMLDEERREAGLQKARHELEHHPEALEALEFAVGGADALIERLKTEAKALEDARGAAARWLAAWVWQCGVRRLELELAPPLQGLHVRLSLGEGRALAQQWFTPEEEEHLSGLRHVTIVTREEATDEPAGVMNTHANLRGYPGLPEHLPVFGR